MIDPASTIFRTGGSTAVGVKVALMLSLLSCPGVAIAQSAVPQIPRLVFVDENRVDIVNGNWSVLGRDISIGNESSGMAIEFFENSYLRNTYSPNLHIRYVPIGGGGGIILADIGIGRWRQFVMGTATGSNTNYTVHPMAGPYNEQGNGPGIMSCTGNYQQLYAGGICSLLDEEGNQLDFQMPTQIIVPGGMSQVFVVRPNQLTKADGEIWTYNPNPSAPLHWESVTSSLGFMLRQESNGYSLINLSEDYCGLPASGCSLSGDAMTTREISLTGGFRIERNGVTVFTFLQDLDRPPCGHRTTVGYPSGRNILYVKENTCFDTKFTAQQGAVYEYSFTGNSPWQARVKDPLGGEKWFGKDIGFDHLLWSQDELGRTTLYTHEGPGTFGGSTRLKRLYRPDSPNISTSSGFPFPGGAEPHTGITEYTYTRGLLSQQKIVPIGGAANQITQLGIAATCSVAQFKVCGKPTYVIDPKGNQTDYTYSSVHGGVLTETLPPDQHGVRPQKRYSYTLLYPKIKNSSGQLVNSTPVWRLTSVSECLSATAGNPASCVGTAAEKVTTHAYNHNNLFRTSETVAAGDGSLSATTSYTYDYRGDVTIVDGPRTDVDDRTYTTYDVLRRKVFEISADPDGAGLLKRLITRHIYDVDGREERTEYGEGTATDGSDFVVRHFERMTFDVVTGKLVKKEVGYP